MFRLLAAWLSMSVAATGAEYAAVANANTVLRAAPSAEAVQIGTVPAGTAVSVTICFGEGAFCHVRAEGIDGYVSGDLLLTDGVKVQAAEAKRWAAIREQAERARVPAWEASNIVAWGDSLSDKTYGAMLDSLLSGRDVAMRGISGENGKQILSRMQLEPDLNNRIVIIWDRHYTRQPPAEYLTDMVAMVEQVRSGRFVIVSDLRATNEVEQPGTWVGIQIDEINAGLKARWPDNYLDINVALGNDPMLRAVDGIHLNRQGYDIVAQQLAKFIADKNW